ncbi:MAG: tetratricopeptide repeat protein [Candidatus Tectomicrobia bacterium]|uniref:Tetratricopeptide repeat protein n=1 Tax=Tectimicrobiota bacterium TaxID=2528274 RepID=A0A932I2Q2_UNCTE|nr:tetratricopeptide repeat protein [Candidatus Tectomicrobia bacterium]
MARRPRDPKARIEALGQRMEKVPSSPAFFPLASLLWQQGDAPRAEKFLRAGLEAHPAYSAARVLLGEILLAMDRPEEAAEELAAAVQVSPWNLQGQRLLADCLHRAGDEAGERKALRIAAMFDSSDAGARALLEEAPRPAPEAKRARPEAGEEAPAPVATPSLAELYTSQGHHAQAAEVYRQLLRKEPGNAEWKKKLGLLEERLAPGASPPGPPASAVPDLDFDLEEEIAPGARSGEEKSPAPAPALDDDLDALLGEADRAQAALPALDQEDGDLALEIAEEPKAGGAAPGAPAGEAALEDDLEAFLEMEDEPAGAAPAPPAASGPKGAAPGGELDDLEGLFAGAEEEPDAAPSPKPPQAALPTAGAEDDLDLDALFAAEEEGAPAAAPPVSGPPAPGRMAPVPEAVSGEELESLFLEDEEGESVPAPPQAQAAPPAAAPTEELDFDLLEEEEAGAKPSAPAEAALPAGEPDELDLGALFEEEEDEDAPAQAASASLGAADGEAIPDEELAGLFAPEEDEAAPAAPRARPEGEDAAVLDLDLEAELLEEDLSLQAEPGGAEEAGDILPGEEAAPAEAPRESRVPEAAPANGAEMDPFLRNLIGLYVEEGNLPQALDLCRKALALGPPPAWLAGRMQEIEGRLAEGLREGPKGDKEGGVRSLSPAEVVERLEDWLRALQRRKARMPASQ